jgi:glycosyltransferase involved in cell wall biosynthesis
MSLSILMLSPQFRPIIGGYERAAERLSLGLAGRGHLVTVVAERRDPSWPAREENDGVRVRRLWCVYRKHWHTVSSLSSLMLFLLRHGRSYDVWHAHQYGEQAVLAATMGKLLRRPVLLKLTSTGAQGISAQLSAAWMSGFKQHALCGVDAVIATTQDVRAEAIAFGIPEKAVHLISNGVDTERFKPRSLEGKRSLCRSLGISAEGVVVFVGRLSEEKNPTGLLKAWRLAFPKMPGVWKLLIVGDGPLREEMKAYVHAEGLSEETLLVGNQSDVEHWVAAADIFVMSSNHEGLSNSLLEAMAAGLPVVSTRVSGSSEILEQTGAGVVVDVGRMDQLADALVRLASDPALRARMGKVGCGTVRAQYSISRVVAQHEELYRSLLLKSADARRRP